MPLAPEDPPASAIDAPGDIHRPLLIYDGDCGFCGYWARYWQKLTGERSCHLPTLRACIGSLRSA